MEETDSDEQDWQKKETGSPDTGPTETNSKITSENLVNQNQQSPSNQMEVHHHPHHEHGKKNWKSYFWEFLMLFLAVFCGFLAEYQLEHVIEHQREKEFMITMVEDLKADTAMVKASLARWVDGNISLDSVADAIKPTLAASDLSKVYRHINNALDQWGFTYNDRTISQLKNAGGFRLVRNKKVSNQIIAYDQFNIDAIKKIASDYNSFYSNVMLIRNRLFAQEIINKIFQQFKYEPVPIASRFWVDSMISRNKLPYDEKTQNVLLFEFKNALLTYRQDYSNVHWGYNRLFEVQEELIRLISEEYQLKKSD